MRVLLATVVLICALAFLAFGVPRLVVADSPAARTLTVERRIEGLTIRDWHRRAVANRKTINTQGRTIRRLQSVARGQLALPTGHWLDGAFLCLHRFEGSWQDDGLPYFGGLQMDPPFVRAHAPAWVLAAFGSNPAGWPAAVQITVGINAWTTRGFGPWPTTRRYCGL